MGIIGVPKLFLQVWGIWPIATLDSDMKKKMYKAYKIFVFGNYTFLNILQMIECIRLIVQKQPFERISKCISLIATLVLMLWKSLIYVKNKIPEMCVNVFETESTLDKVQDRKIYTTYKNVEKNTRHVNFWVLGSASFTLLSFTLEPFVDLFNIGPDFWDFHNVTFMHELYLPFNKREHSQFIIFLNILMAAESGILNGATQTTFLGLTIYASLKLRILQIKLKQFDTETKKESDIVKTYKGLLKEHQDVISFITTLNQATKNVLLMSFLLNSIKLASGLFQVIATQDVAALAFPLFYSVFLISEVILLGWMSNEIKVQSLDVANAAYSSSWFNATKDVKTMLQIMIMRAQKPLTMSIGPFSTMSTDTIVTTMKAAYSYTTLLSNQK